MSTDPNQLAAQRATGPSPRNRRRNVIHIEVDVGYVSAEVDLAEIDTAELVTELEARRGTIDEADMADDMADDMALVERAELRRIRELLLARREPEAIEAMRTIIADTLGTAI